MNFVALLLGLGIERLATRFFHLREFHWLYPLADRLSAALQPKTKSITLIGVVGFVVLAVLPVALISWLLSGTLFHIPYFLFSVFVLLFSLGPRDLATEVQDYCKAVRD
ncbi:MAG: regulatory signaling modulator protein AmpE, partial [Gammaproteobacteria bacterium]|nr:regulatory signaling modulator protein AmpE [Gammaproteobacteria bacterium]